MRRPTTRREDRRYRRLCILGRTASQNQSPPPDPKSWPAPVTAGRSGLAWRRSSRRCTSASGTRTSRARRSPAYAPRRRDPVLAVDGVVLSAVLCGDVPDRGGRFPTGASSTGRRPRSSLVMRSARWGTSSSAPNTRAPCFIRPTPTCRTPSWPGCSTSIRRERLPIAARRAHDDAGAAADPRSPAARAVRAVDGDDAGALDAHDEAALHRRRRAGYLLAFLGRAFALSTTWPWSPSRRGQPS